MTLVLEGSQLCSSPMKWFQYVLERVLVAAPGVGLTWPKIWLLAPASTSSQFIEGEESNEFPRTSVSRAIGEYARGRLRRLVGGGRTVRIDATTTC